MLPAMALDAPSLSFFGSAPYAEHDRVRGADTQMVARSLSCTRGAKEKLWSHGLSAAVPPSSLGLVSHLVICGRSPVRLGKQGHVVRTGSLTEDVQKGSVVLLAGKVESRINIIQAEGRVASKCSLISFGDAPPRRRLTVKSVDSLSSRTCGFSAGSALQTESCSWETSQPSWKRDTTVTAAATDSDQTSPSQNGGGEKGLPQKPHPAVQPSQVVQAQLKALHDMDLALVYEFASPGNKAHTGPLSQFSEMLEGRPYRVMLGHTSADILSTITIGPNRFQQRISIVGAGGAKGIFIWSLSKQEEGPYEGCWMTDTVRRDEF